MNFKLKKEEEENQCQRSIPECPLCQQPVKSPLQLNKKKKKKKKIKKITKSGGKKSSDLRSKPDSRGEERREEDGGREAKLREGCRKKRARGRCYVRQRGPQENSRDGADPVADNSRRCGHVSTAVVYNHPAFNYSSWFKRMIKSEPRD